MTAVAQQVRSALEQARETTDRDDLDLAMAIEARLMAIRARYGSGPYRRVDKCIEMLIGSRRRYVPQPGFMYFPELPAIEFFDRDQFPWLDAVEAATEDIRAELTAVLANGRAGFESYVAWSTPFADVLDRAGFEQWKELNDSRRWSVYFLWNQGVAQAAHQARCPRTVQALKAAPVAADGRTTLFSVLDAGSRIPPHHGVTNTRVTVHLPLVVPPDCGLRVGSETREWVPGKAWVFDDTFEHEAWNESDAPRALLIFDIWNPFLTAAERDLICDLTRGFTEAAREHYRATRDGS